MLYARHVVNSLFLVIGTFAVYALSKAYIVFILVDDLGYYDLHFLGYKRVGTSAINLLTKESMYFNNAYAAVILCSPTSASLLTSKPLAELKLTCHITGIGMIRYLHNIKASYMKSGVSFTDYISLNKQILNALTKHSDYNNTPVLVVPEGRYSAMIHKL